MVNQHQKILFLFGLIGMLFFLHNCTEQPSSENSNQCQVCHQMQGFSRGHAPEIIGCASCHAGDASQTEKENAHQNMIAIPGNLPQAKQTCGAPACHLDFSENIHNTLMASGRGIVSVNRFAFGEKSSPDGPGHLGKLGTSPADQHLRQLCASCHLGQLKTKTGPITEASRGGGCLACHLSYSDENILAWQQAHTKEESPKIHPKLTRTISNKNCFGCHSRSTRISTSFEGWHETLLDADSLTDKTSFRILPDGRVFEQQPADIHHTRGMNCVDCHTWRETMGDGTEYNHQGEQVEISCQDCHNARPELLASLPDLGLTDIKFFLTYFPDEKPEFLIKTQKKATPLSNVFLDKDQKIKIKQKSTSRIFTPKAPLPVCTSELISGHERLSCKSCHTNWAPTCIGCHTEFESETPAFDHQTQQETQGAWIEYADAQTAEPPTLGIFDGKIDTFIPGMILTLHSAAENAKQTALADTLFRRFYAPVAPHTTAAKGRDCSSCHLNPVALGYGRGELILKQVESGKHVWAFSSTFSAHPDDGLPFDAWITFLRPSPSSETTRTNARPFTISEQERILTVGACLTCHVVKNGEIPEMYRDFQRALRRISKACKLPVYPK